MGRNAQNNDAYRPGNGASVWGTFNLSAGTVLNIAVGQQATPSPPGSYGGGGGGGTFIWIENADVPLIVAGGGGGASYGSTNEQYYGTPGQADFAGSQGSMYGGMGGINGGGGNQGSNSNGGGGGGGWYSPGQCPSYPMCGNGRSGNFQGGSRGTSFSEGGTLPAHDPCHCTQPLSPLPLPPAPPTHRYRHNRH